MTVAIDFRVLELICGRLCHELVSPVGAINNGVELLDEDDPDFVKEAMDLIAQSARRAGQRLAFYRFAYGTSGVSAGAVNGGELVNGLLEGGKVRCDWDGGMTALALPWQRLACNMLVLAAEALPRGGTITIRPDGAGVTAVAEGDPVTIAAEVESACSGTLAVEALGARSIHAYYTAALARHMGTQLAVGLPAPGQGVVTAMPVA